MDEKTIRLTAADELEYVASILQERIDLHEGTVYEDVGTILRSWKRDLLTGARQQREHTGSRQ